MKPILAFISFLFFTLSINPVNAQSDDNVKVPNEIKKENVKQKDQPKVNDRKNSKSTK